jgi:hypothetical protein
MKKQNNKPNIKREQTRSMELGRKISPATKKKAFLIAALSFVSIFIYFGAVPLLRPTAQFIVHIAYMVIFGVSLIAYITYNRAFTRKNITIDMLPNVWSAEQKAAYVADGEERLKKSQWLLLIVIPTLVPIGVDSLILFVWDPYLKGFFTGIVGGI